MKKLFSNSIFKKAAAFMLSLCMLIYLIPDINFEVHAVDGFNRNPGTDTGTGTATLKVPLELDYNDVFDVDGLGSDLFGASQPQNEFGKYGGAELYGRDANGLIPFTYDVDGDVPNDDGYLTFIATEAGTYTFTWTLYSTSVKTRTCVINVPGNTYTVAFNSNEGTAIADLTNVTSGSKITAPTPPTKSGFIFGGWYKDATLTDDWDFATDTVTAGIMLYAKWSAPTTYTVAFNSNGGSSTPDNQTIASGGKVTEPTPPTKTGFTFGGWYKDAPLTDDWDFATDTVTAGITLYAKWTAVPTYTVAFDSNGGSSTPDNQTIASGGKVTEPTPPTKAGFAFGGWYKDTALTDDWDFETDTVTAGITLYAKWTATVAFNSNGGSSTPDNQTIASGGKVTAPTGVTKNHYDLVGWYDGETKWDFANSIVTGAVTLKAKWTLHPYQIHYDLDGGTNDPANPSTCDYEHEVNLNPATKVGAIFDGWYLESTYENITGGFTVHAIASDITVYAKWIADSTKPTVSSVSVPANGTYKTGDILNFTVNFSENVNVVGSPLIPITIGGSTKYASYASGTGTSALIFSYTVTNIDNDSDGIVVGSAINLNSGTIRDSANNNAVLTLNNKPSTSGILIDNAGPIMVGGINNPVDKTYKSGDKLYFIFSYNENVTVVTTDVTPSIELVIGNTTRCANYLDGSGSSSLIFSYTVVSGDSDSDGIAVNSGITLNNGTIKDSAGNNADIIFADYSLANVLVDALAPDAPSVPDLDSGSDTGSSSTDNITKDTTPTFTGTAEANSTVKLYDGAVKIGETTANGSGNWTITSSTLSEGTYSITAKVTDAMGNESVASAALTVKIDITPPTRNDVTDGQIFPAAISFLSLGGTATLTKDSGTPASYTGGIISDNGSYVLTITDTAGNTYSVSFTIAIPKVPSAPQNLTVTPGNGQAVITFDPPADNGGAAITAYRLKIIRVSDNVIQMIYPTSNSYTVSSLINGEEYKFSILAKNNAGLGAYSSEITAYIGRTGRSIVSTTIGDLSGGNVINVPYGTTVSALKSGLTVSDGASAEINTSIGLGAVANQDTTIVTSSMIVLVRAENGFGDEHTISVNSAKYTVSFNSNGGTAVADLTNVTSGSKITAPSAPTKSNYTFNGWYKNAGLTEKWDFATDTVTSNITLYAKWTAVSKYTVSFNSNGGTSIADLTNVVSGSKINAPTAPTKSDYTFSGWYKDSGLTDDWDFATDTVTSNITLFAKWISNTPTPDPTPASTEPPATNPPAEKPTIIVKETPQNVPSPELISVNPVGDPFDKSVEVRLKDDPKVKEEVQKALDNSDTKLPENAKIFPLDISMYVTGTDTKVQPKDGTAVEITCPVPKELLSDKDSLFVVCVVNGKLNILPVKIVVKKGVPCAVFTASHFSPYAFVIDKDGKLATLAAGEPTLENASPLSQHNGIPFIILSIGMIGGIIIFKRRKAK